GLLRPAQQALVRADVGEIDADPNVTLARQRPRKRLRVLLREVDRRDARAAVRERRRDGRPDPAGRSRDDDSAPGEPLPEEWSLRVLGRHSGAETLYASM